MPSSETATAPQRGPMGLVARVRDFLNAFRDLLHLPRAFWLINLFFMIDSMAYFGILTLMQEYLHLDVKLADWVAGFFISFFTGAVTVFMIGFGGVGEKLGWCRGLALAITLCLVGRIGYCLAPGVGFAAALALVLAGLVLIALGEGMVQPVCYAGIKQFTDEKTSAMGYGLIYAIMNFGIFLIGFVSPLIRVPVEKVHEATALAQPAPATIWRFFADRGVSGLNAVNWTCTAITLVALLLLLAFMTMGADQTGRRSRQNQPSPLSSQARQAPWYARVGRYLSEGPFSNARFVFFIFMLLPVQTLFAHQWLTMPAYVLRAYSEGVANHMEWIVNWINPGIIFFGVPLITALTRRANVYTLMIVGSAVSALPTFLLAFGPHTPLLIVYLFLFSIGEALWSPRFLQYAAELAPEGKLGQYMGLANVPWIMAKSTTGLYSGYFLGRYCPTDGPQDTQTMWLIYSLIAIASPIGLLLGRRWVMRGSLGAPQAAV